MRSGSLIVSTIFLVASIGWTQSYEEKSGQTTVFVLAEGARTSPAGKSAKPAAVSGITAAVFKTKILISLVGKARGNFDVAIHDYSGERKYHKVGCKGASLEIQADAFAMSSYTIYVTVDGKTYSRKFELTK